MTTIPPFQLPTSDPTSQPFWDAAARRELWIKHCDDCGRFHFYPRSFCPFCWSERVEWVPASGKATVYTYSVVHRNDLPAFRDRVPYAAAIVTLEEGPRMMTQIVDIDPAEVRVGLAVTVDFAPAGEDGTGLVPVFVPSDPSPG